MKPDRRRTSHEHMIIGVSLSLLGGFLDAYTFVLKGGVFANAQTGNLVLLCIAVIQGELSRAAEYLVPVAMFALGIFVSELIKNNPSRDRGNMRIKAVLLFEGVIITGVALMGDAAGDFAVTSIISFLAAVQVANFNKVNGRPVATTMITGNLRSGMTHLSSYVLHRQRSDLRHFFTYFTVIIAFGAGAGLGSELSHLAGNQSILFCLIFLLSAFIFLVREDRRVIRDADNQ